jgi:galactan endo-1,6-beta-galactosidase
MAIRSIRHSPAAALLGALCICGTVARAQVTSPTPSGSWMSATPSPAARPSVAATPPPKPRTPVQIDPQKNYGPWQGWGTALAWFAKVMGNREDIADLLFSLKTVNFNGAQYPGLGMNIVRYNAGASSWNTVNGRQMVVSSHILPFRQMEGYWLDPASDDPQSTSWNWNVDANQRKMMQMACDRGATRFELFSNSPMWWMCANLNPSGAQRGADNNLSPDYYGKFAEYLATIAKHAKDNWAINFTTVEPFNESTSKSWSANGRQEGCHFSRDVQAKILPLLRAELDKRGLTATPISASDDSTYDFAIATWNSFTPGVKKLVNQVNVHGYQGGGGHRDVLYDITSKDGKPVWNSEYGEINGTGLDLARNLDLDIRLLHIQAWNYWQPFDRGGWGFFSTDVPNGKINAVNPKYYVLAQYTRHIRPGLSILDTGDTDTVAAYDPMAHKLVLVIRSDAAGEKTLDLTKFQSATGPVTRWITEPKGASRYEMHQDVKISAGKLTVTLPESCVETFEIENVSL